MQHAELIVAYLKGELSGPQAQDFEQQMAADLALQQAVREYRILLEGFKGMQHESFRREVAAWDVDTEADEEGVQIMAYLEGRMSTAERVAWEQRLEREPRLARATAEYRQLMEGFKGMRQDDFAAEVQGWAKDLPAGEVAPESKLISIDRHKNSWWRYAAAAAVLALVAASFWLFGPFSGAQPTLADFRQDNYVEPAALMIRGEEEVLTEAARAYNRQEYPAAIAALQLITSRDSLFVAARYLEGHSYYRLGQYQQAVEAFTQSLDPPAGQNYDLRDFNRDNAAWTRILAELALLDAGPDPLVQQDLHAFLTTFLQQADRSDVYYAKALALQKMDL